MFDHKLKFMRHKGARNFLLNYVNIIYVECSFVCIVEETKRGGTARISEPRHTRTNKAKSPVKKKERLTN